MIYFYHFFKYNSIKETRAHRLFDKNKKIRTQKETEVDCFTPVSFLFILIKGYYKDIGIPSHLVSILNACAMLKGRYRSTTLHYS